MGSAFDNWEAFTGPLYMGAGSSWEVIWFLVAAAICVLALVAGSRHELDSYRRLRSGERVVPGAKTDD